VRSEAATCCPQELKAAGPEQRERGAGGWLGAMQAVRLSREPTACPLAYPLFQAFPFCLIAGTSVESRNTLTFEHEEAIEGFRRGQELHR